MTFILPDFKDASWCARMRAAIDRGHLSRAEIVSDGYRVDDEARRVLDAEVAPPIIAEVDAALAGVRPQVSKFFALSLTRNEGAGFIRYESGGFYRRHRDCLPHEFSEFQRIVSLVLFLTSVGEGDGCCEGGALRLHDAADGRRGVPFDIAPAAGTLVAFPSTWIHEVLPVTAGVRDAIVDWLY